jgi:hypothetical protein
MLDAMNLFNGLATHAKICASARVKERGLFSFAFLVTHIGTSPASSGVGIKKEVDSLKLS